MKTIYRIITLCILCVLCRVSPVYAMNDKPFVIPQLKEWKGGEGVFMLTSKTRITYPKGAKQLEHIARMLADDCQAMFGFMPQVAAGKAQTGDIALALKKDASLGQEGYNLRIGKQIKLTAPQPIGVYWGTRTLLQLAEQDSLRQLPQGETRDFPDYPMRGFMMDCGRKFIPLADLQSYVKLMAYYKMNTLQIHLNDNGFKQFFEQDWNKTYAAFRLESETFPELTARDGFYTKQEFIDLQKLAEERFVEIIPEIDAPAHTLAFNQFKPEIGSKEYGMDHLDLFNPETYKFMDALFKEYLEGENPVFRGPRVHIGTDEYSNKNPEVVEKFRAFTDRYIRYVESFGKQACIWGALTHANGQTPVKSDNVIMSAWYNGYANPKEMVKQGYKLISIPDGWLYIVPAAGYYYDYLNTKELYNSWTPAHVGDAVFPEKDPAILGGMFAVWNDHVGNGISCKDIYHRVFPAMQTLAVKMWSGAKPAMPFEEFDQLRLQLSEAPGVNELGKLAQKPQTILQQKALTPGSQTPYTEIGYNYRVSFDIEGTNECQGTELFRSPNAVFYLSDPISGRLGFARDGYLFTFRQNILKGDRMHISIEGTNKGTRLYINDKLVEDLNIKPIYLDKEKAKMNLVRTLVFPLKQVGNFKSHITNLLIEQL